MNLKVLLCFVYGVSCKVEVAEVQQALEKTLKYLESKEVVTGMLGWGANEIECAIVNVPKMSPIRSEMLKGYDTRFLVMVKKFEEKLPPSFFKEFVSNPQYWHSEDEYKHRPGRLTTTKGPALTLDQIVQKSTSNKEVGECMMKVVEENKSSVIPRVCKLSCRDKMWDTNKLEGGFPMEERVLYIVLQTLLNCTNDNIDARTKAVVTYCNNVKMDVDAMDKMIADPKFDSARPIYLYKLIYCGTYGFPEFFPEDRIRALIKMINPDGSVGGKSLNPREIGLQTALMADIMAGILRLLTETGQ